MSLSFLFLISQNIPMEKVRTAPTLIAQGRKAVLRAQATAARAQAPAHLEEAQVEAEEVQAEEAEEGLH